MLCAYSIRGTVIKHAWFFSRNPGMKMGGHGMPEGVARPARSPDLRLSAILSYGLDHGRPPDGLVLEADPHGRTVAARAPVYRF